jgi:hypothetical protein
MHMKPITTEDIKREATSIKIDPNLWKNAKMEAFKFDMTVSEVVEEAIREWIKKKGKQA